ncbi:hypothetical protein IFM89_016940 [Coptis chinensis]|uniref:non-specific serine/threonine protein kinase n=1 Tax=Coptis chinensis TaxID=261450 RepID=A0A835H923_9MAGN|nr:hypothetical protein IFM89_016940 [Coptis chinensis]
MDEMVHGWVNTHREEEEPTEDFLNDENEPENRETGIQDMWRGAGHFDLNSSFLICSQHLNTASTPTTTIPPPTGVHELLECHVCTNSMYPPAYSLEIKPGEPVLDWPTRKRVALGIARGLEYLHEHCNPRIIHRDHQLKNLCVDVNYNLFADCMEVAGHDVPTRGSFCQLCLYKKQLIVLQSYYKLRKSMGKESHQTHEFEASESVTKVKVVQQIFLNYLPDATSTDDAHLFVRWSVKYWNIFLIRFCVRVY